MRATRSGLFAAAVLLPSVTAGTVPTANTGMNIDAFWEYGDPAASEVRFRAALPQANPDERLELTTQIARTYSLRRDFPAAHALLDDVERQLAGAGPAPRTRYFLERGRTFNSAGDKARAAALFLDAWNAARAAHLDGLAVDAAHMLAIVESLPTASEWTRKGIELARSTDDPKARALLPALLNNEGWNLYDAGRYAEALRVFRDAETAWRATGRQPQGRIATWSVARTLRSLQRYEDALNMQYELEREWQTVGEADGYVFEEIAENLEALGRAPAATPYFRRAQQELGKDPQFAQDEPVRWQRITSLAQRSF